MKVGRNSMRIKQYPSGKVGGVKVRAFFRRYWHKQERRRWHSDAREQLDDHREEIIEVYGDTYLLK